MEELPIFLNHNIARMPIAYPQNIGSHEIGRTGSKIILFSDDQIFLIIVVLKIKQSCFLIKCVN